MPGELEETPYLRLGWERRGQNFSADPRQEPRTSQFECDRWPSRIEVLKDRPQGGSNQQ